MFYFLVALAAFIFKAYWWFASRDYDWANARWYILLGAFSILNLAECLIYDLHIDNKSPEFLLLMYYLAFTFSCAAIYFFISDQSNKIQKYLSVFLITTSIILAPIYIFTDHFIYSYDDSSYPVKALKGEYFWVCLLYLWVSMLGVIATLTFNAIKSVSAKEKIESIYHACAFSIFLIVGLIIAIGMALKLNVNGSALFPLATSAFLAVTIWHKCLVVKGLSDDPRRLVPFTNERALFKSVNKAVFGCSIDSLSLKDALTEAEKSIMLYHLETGDYSKSKLARKLNLSRQSLENRLDKYGLMDYFK